MKSKGQLLYKEEKVRLGRSRFSMLIKIFPDRRLAISQKFRSNVTPFLKGGKVTTSKHACAFFDRVVVGGHTTRNAII